VLAQRPAGRLTLTKFFFGGEWKALQIPQTTIMFAPKTRSAEFFLVEHRSHKQVIELFGEPGVLKFLNFFASGGFDSLVQILQGSHGGKNERLSAPRLY